MRSIAENCAAVGALRKGHAREKTIVILVDQLLVVHLGEGQMRLPFNRSPIVNFIAVHVFRIDGLAIYFDRTLLGRLWIRRRPQRRFTQHKASA